MSFRFRPELNSLEARDVPASFSFQLADGTSGLGTFSDPHADAAQSYILTLTDVSVVYNGAVYQQSGPVYALYDYGSLMEIVGTLVGPDGVDTIELQTDVAVHGNYSGALAHDPADAQMTFTLSDGTSGAISYAVPWSQVDPAQASQSIAPMAYSFHLNIAGQNFLSGAANYTTAPTLVFEYGNLVGVSFALTPPPGFAYTSITGTFDVNGANIITAVQAGTGQQLIAAPLPRQRVVFEFANATVGEDYTITLSFRDGNGQAITTIAVSVSKTDSVGDIADKVAVAVGGTGKIQALRGSSDVILTPKADAGSWDQLQVSLTNPLGQVDPSLKGPTLVRRDIVSVTGQIQNPNP